MIRSITLSDTNREDGITASDGMVFDKETLTCHLLDNGFLIELDVMELEAFWNRAALADDNTPLAYISSKMIGLEGKLQNSCTQTIVITIQES